MKQLKLIIIALVFSAFLSTYQFSISAYYAMGFPIIWWVLKNKVNRIIMCILFTATLIVEYLLGSDFALGIALLLPGTVLLNNLRQPRHRHPSKHYAYPATTNPTHSVVLAEPDYSQPNPLSQRVLN